MPDENDQHANVSADKKNGKIHHISEATNGKPLKPGQREKKKDPRPPAESPRTWVAPEIERIANRLINGKRAHMSVLRQARVEYIFSNAEREGDELNLAKAHRFNAAYSFGYDEHKVPHFVLRVSKPQWDRLPEDLQEQAIYHYLLFFSSDSNGRWRIERPDIIAFGAEISEFPDSPRWNEGLKRARQLGLFDGIASTELAAETTIATPAR